MKAMKLLPILVLISSFAVAQEIQQLSAEQAGKIARKVAEALGSPTDAPFAVDADAEKSAGIKGSSDVRASDSGRSSVTSCRSGTGAR